MSEVSERIAVLETMQSATHELLSDHILKDERLQEEVLAELKAINLKLAKQSGFIAGVSAVVTLLATILVAVLTATVKWFKS